MGPPSGWAHGLCVFFLPFYLLNDLEYVLYLNLKVYPGVVHGARVDVFYWFFVCNQWAGRAAIAQYY